VVAGQMQRRSIPIQGTGYSIVIKPELADDLPFNFQNRNADVVFLAPVRARVDIVNEYIGFAAKQRHQLFDQHLTEVASLPAVNMESGHSVINHGR